MNEAIWRERRAKARGPFNVFWRATQILSLSLRGYDRHQCELRASALTYRSFLSFVPLFALLFSVLKQFQWQDVVTERLITWLTTGKEASSENTIPGIVETVHNIVDFINRTQVGGLTGLGLVGLLMVGVSMLRMVEATMNSIWGISEARPVSRMAADYISLIIVSPILLAVGVYVMTVFKVPEAFPLAGWLNHVVMAPVLSIVPYIVIWGVFVFLYSFMPNTRVHWSSALIGGLIAGSLWHLAQAIYIQLTIHFYAHNYNAIYGALAWIFILIVWVYVSWSVLLFGAEITCAHDQLDDYRRKRRAWPRTSEAMETLALRVAALLSRPSLASLSDPFEPVTLEGLSDRLLVPPEPIEEILRRYEEAGLIRRDTAPAKGRGRRFLLCRSPQDISLLDLLRLVRHGTLASRTGSEPAEPAGSLAAIGGMLSRELSRMTLKDLAQMELERIQTLDLLPPSGPFPDETSPQVS